MPTGELPVHAVHPPVSAQPTARAEPWTFAGPDTQGAAPALPTAGFAARSLEEYDAELARAFAPRKPLRRVRWLALVAVTLAGAAWAAFERAEPALPSAAPALTAPAPSTPNRAPVAPDSVATPSEPASDRGPSEASPEPAAKRSRGKAIRAQRAKRTTRRTAEWLPESASPSETIERSLPPSPPRSRLGSSVIRDNPY